jgi:hypothetical protein
MVSVACTLQVAAPLVCMCMGGVHPRVCAGGSMLAPTCPTMILTLLALC